MQGRVCQSDHHPGGTVRLSSEPARSDLAVMRATEPAASMPRAGSLLLKVCQAHPAIGPIHQINVLSCLVPIAFLDREQDDEPLLVEKQPAKRGRRPGQSQAPERRPGPPDVGSETGKDLLRQKPTPMAGPSRRAFHLLDSRCSDGSEPRADGPQGKGIHAMPFRSALERTIPLNQDLVRTLLGGIGRSRRDGLGHCSACPLALLAGLGTLLHLRFVMP